MASSVVVGGLISGDISNILFSAGAITTAFFLVSLCIFAAFALKSKTLKSFQSQISIFIGIYVLGELLELDRIQAITGVPQAVGSQIHVLATLVITTILWSRMYYSRREVRNLVDQPDAAALE